MFAEVIADVYAEHSENNLVLLASARAKPDISKSLIAARKTGETCLRDRRARATAGKDSEQLDPSI